jgi:hypothetical protein
MRRSSLERLCFFIAAARRGASLPRGCTFRTRSRTVTVEMSSSWRAGQLADQCDAIYTKLFNALHIGFIAQPDWIDRNAVSVMFEFKICIEELLQQRLADGLCAGPRFLYDGP